MKYIKQPKPIAIHHQNEYVISREEEEKLNRRLVFPVIKKPVTIKEEDYESHSINFDH